MHRTEVWSGMDVRRYYVISARGEQGPFNHEELCEAFRDGAIGPGEQVRTAMGTMVGNVAEVLATPVYTGIPQTSSETSVRAPLELVRARRRLFVPLLAVLMIAGGLSVWWLAEPVPASTASRTSYPVLERPPAPDRVKPAVPASTSPTEPLPAVTMVHAPGPPAVTPTGPAERGMPIAPDAQDVLTLRAQDATIVGTRARLIGRNTPAPCIGEWNDGTGSVEWNASLPRAGRYRVEITYACAPTGVGSTFQVAIGSATLESEVQSSGSWSDFKSFVLGETTITRPMMAKISVHPLLKKGSGLMKLRGVKLLPLP